ncbi:MAG: JAB domain-containing protein [Candidatus Aminicenantes bacterium]|nr:JAB domain-containing protein [Candidatus Aminicenantes bacterium]
MQVRLSKDQKIKVSSSHSVFKVMRQILLRENEIEREQEHVWVLGLASNCKILNVELVSLGDINKVFIKPMQIFRLALMKGSAAIIMVHNHPSGDLKPTPEDLDTTDQMIQVGKIIGVEVIDHLIISTEKHISFDKAGLMEKLADSKKWVPPFVEQERIRKEKEKIRKEALKLGKQEGIKEGKKLGKQMGLEKGMKKKAKEIAKKSLKEGLSIELISNLTGLTKDEIEKL